MRNRFYITIIVLLFINLISADIREQNITVKFYKQVNNHIMDSTILNLEFSDNLPQISKKDLQDSIDIKLKSLIRGKDFTWEVINQIEIKYLTNIYVKSLYLYFINPYAIHTQDEQKKNFLSLDSYTISVEVGPVVKFKGFENSEINVMKYILQYSIGAFCFMYFLVSIKMIKESLNLFWAWVDIIQVYNLFLFIDTNHFQNVSSLLRACSILNFWFFDFIEKYKNETILSNTRETDSESAITKIPYRFVLENYTSYFIQNAFFPLFIIGSGLALLLVSAIVCPGSRFGIQNVFRNMIQFSLPIRGTLICCCQIFLSAFLFFKNFGGTLDITFSIISMVYYAFCIFSFIFILNRGQPIPLAEQTTKEKYGSLYEGLILKAVLKRNFNIFFMIRKIVMAICLVFSDNSNMAQMIFLLVVQIVFMGLIASKLPYENGRNNFWMVISELCLSFFLLLMSAWVIFDYLGEDFIFFEKRMHLSWALHSAIICSIYSRVIGFFSEFFYIYKKEKEQQKRDQKLMQNDSSILDETNGVKQKLIFHHDHDHIKDNQQANEDIENPDDFQFIEMPDINELIKKEEQEELEEKKNQQNNSIGNDQQNDHHQVSDDEDGNKQNNSANNETVHTNEKTNSKN